MRLPCPDKLGFAMTENIPPHPSPLPPRGEGVRREIFLPLFI